MEPSRSPDLNFLLILAALGIGVAVLASRATRRSMP
jgi:hypothetical protein